jgi:hypothetical protein
MKNLLIVNMVLSAVNVVLGVASGNWSSAMGWGVALLWEFVCFKKMGEQ